MERGKLEPVFGIQVMGYSGLLTEALAASPAATVFVEVFGSILLLSYTPEAALFTSLYSGSTLVNHSNFFYLPSH